ncbi:MAG: radical SAM protein [Candidatus Melainabacteria bacterium]|nr:radical SAM protein [Candidatus Melainabacteria bacterium]
MPPLLANYYLTYKCNSRCTYCDIPVKPENIPIKETSAEVIIENLAALKRLGVKVVDFTGGEPLIYKKLPEVLRAAKEMGFYTSIANTGTLYPGKAKELAGLIDDLKFSLSTIDPESYKKERGINGFARVIESIKIAKSLGEQPSIIATATPESIWHMENVIGLAQELGVVVLLGPVFDYFGQDTLGEEGVAELHRLSKFDNVAVNWAFTQFFLDGGNQVKAPRCRAISSTIVISPDDHLLLPCYHMHDERLKIKHENGRSNLDEMWHSMHVQERRKKEGAWDFCQGCTIWCYFETSFLWPPDKYFFLNLKSKARWGKEKAKQYLEIKNGMKLTRKLAGDRDAVLAAISNNPLNMPVRPGSNGAANGGNASGNGKDGAGNVVSGGPTAEKGAASVESAVTTGAKNGSIDATPGPNGSAEEFPPSVELERVPDDELTGISDLSDVAGIPVTITRDSANSGANQ